MSHALHAVVSHASSAGAQETHDDGESSYQPQFEAPCRFGKRRLVRFIAVGGIAELYAARQADDEREIALKIVRPDHHTPEARARHLEHLGCDLLPWEFNVARSVDHPNVIRVFECGQVDDVDYVALELFEAQTLADSIYCERRKDLFGAMEHIITQCAEALDALHCAGYLHCDVKPQNFLLDADQQIKLIDFDISSPLVDPQHYRRPKSVMGSRGYISPEQRYKEPIDERTDVYSLGVMLHVWLTGDMPYAERRTMTAREQNELPLVPMLRRIDPRISEPMADLVARMLSNEKEERPRNMRQFLEEFRGLPAFVDERQPV